MVIIIICILLSLSTKNITKKRIKESPYNIEYINVNIPNSPFNVLQENINMYRYRNLINNITNISQIRIKFNDYTIHNTYTQLTTGDYLMGELDTIMVEITKIINDNSSYDFEKTNYGDIEIWIDKENNKNIKYELFMWDKKNYFEVKFLVDIIVLSPTSKIMIQLNNKKYKIYKNGYLMPLNIKIPCNSYRQLTPLDVIPTGNMVITDIKNDECADKRDCPNINNQSYLFINTIIIQGSTLVIDYDKNLIKNKMIPIMDTTGGISDISLEYLGVDGDNSPIQDKAKESNKWIDLLSMPKWLGQFPCKAPPLDWDVDANYYYKNTNGNDNNKINCIGTHWSPVGEPLQPNYYPTLATLPMNCGRYNWMFDQSSDMPSYPTGGISKH